MTPERWRILDAISRELPRVFALIVSDPLLPAHLRRELRAFVRDVAEARVWDRVVLAEARREGSATWWEEANADAWRAPEGDRLASEQSARLEAYRAARGPTKAGYVDAGEVKRRLCDPRYVATALGLKWWPASGRGCKVCCPAQDENTPSCSLTVGADGTLRVRCFGCGWTADVFGLVAAVRGLDVKSDFVAVKLEASAL